MPSELPTSTAVAAAASAEDSHEKEATHISFNDKTLLAAIADPLVLILFVIYFIGIFKEKKVAKKQIAVSESDK